MPGLYFDMKTRNRPVKRQQLAVNTHACRRSYQCAAPGSSPFRPTLPQADASRSPIDPARADRAALVSSQAGSSPELVLAAAAAQPTAGAPPSIFGHKSTVGEPLILPYLFPGQGRRRSRPIPASRAALHAKDYIASFSFFQGCFSWTRGLAVIERKFQGAAGKT
jgi:hypothetical protein